MLETQMSAQFYGAMSLQQQQRNIQKDTNHNSGRTTRSGTPDSKGYASESRDEFNSDTSVKSQYILKGTIDIG